MIGPWTKESRFQFPNPTGLSLSLSPPVSSPPFCSASCADIREKLIASPIFFYIFNKKVYNNEFTYDTTYELLYDTTNTVPGGAIYHDYPQAFTINLRNTTKTKYTLKYKVLDINI